MKSPIIPIVFLVSFSAVLIWQTGEDDKHEPETSPARLRVVGATSLAIADPAPRTDPVLPMVRPETAPWAHPEVMHELRVAVMSDDPKVWRAAIAQALPALATDQDVQLQVGGMLPGVDGLAWQLLACMHCTLADPRLGHECAREGLCDPNLALVDVFRKNFGEQKTADALARMEEIKAAIASGASLAPFTEIP